MTLEEFMAQAEEMERGGEQTARDVDALLATACSRLLNSGALINHMRVLRAQGRMGDYWLMAVKLGEHLTVAGHSITTAHNKLIASQLSQQQQTGGPVN